MANIICSGFTIIIMFMSLSIITSARPPMKNSVADPTSPTPSLVYRLKLEGDNSSSFCWDSMIQLQHCTGEVVTFFLNGETSIGPGCCKAIETAGRKCWPAMLGALGFTATESDVLQGYCAEQDSDEDGDSIFLRPPPSTSLVSKPENAMMHSAP